MAYVANANDPTQPLDTVDRSTAASEFRKLKSMFNGFSTVASATTPDIFNTANQLINYTGAAACTGFAPALTAGTLPRILFCGAGCQFTASANLLIDRYSAGQVFITITNTILKVYAITTTQFRITMLSPVIATQADTANYATNAGHATYADSITGVPAISSGSYIPATSSLLGCTVNALSQNNYIRVGNYMTVSGRIELVFTAQYAEVNLTPPIPASLNFGDYCAGTVSSITRTGVVWGVVTPTSAYGADPNKINLAIRSGNIIDGTIYDVNYHYTYRIA